MKHSLKKGGFIYVSDQQIKGIYHLKDTLDNNWGQLDLVGKIIFFFILFLIVFLIFSITYFFLNRYTRKLKKKINCSNCSHFFKKSKDGSLPIMIQSNKLNQRPENKTSTWSFWININEWYYRYGLWKNIFFKGSSFKPENELSWDDVGKQCPGIWMTPSQNNLRAVFTTKNFCVDNRIEYYLEYCQINDIPIGVWNFITIVLIHKTVSFYLNGKLVRTCVFKGEPEFNNGPLQVSYSGGFKGDLLNFRYIGRNLKPSEIYELYELGPKEKGKHFWQKNIHIPKSFECQFN